MILSRLKNIGPGAMVAAAFIGPGTVTTATMAGASYGYTLLWAIVFSISATIVLQEMSARLGTVGRMGVGEALRSKMGSTLSFYFTAFLVVSAIFIGNAAYEAGNISGAALGANSLIGEESRHWIILMIGMVAFMILYSGKYHLIEKFLVILVSILAVVFIISAILIKPDLSEVMKGLFVPTIPSGSLILIVGLIGTTVVPYNLFLHASASRKRWENESQLRDARIDTIFSVIVGGLITMCILITSAAAFQNTQVDVFKASDLVFSLRPVLGNFSDLFLSFGFLAAGLSSAITAPLATAFAISELLGKSSEMKSTFFRVIWMLVLFAGIFFSVSGLKPLSIILFAQFANGLLLPIIATFLVWIMNDKSILKSHTNKTVINVLGVIVILITIILGLKSISGVLSQLT
jgi:NRAMP (natural resistance-associated macrophage protein)-like metal ion transporter